MLNYFPGNNSQSTIAEKQPQITVEKSPVNEQPQTKPTPKVVEADPLPIFDENLVNIRINNCFVNAKKEFLQDLKIKWQEYLKNVNDKRLLSVLLDTTPVAASEKNAIISCPLDGTANLINSKIITIENEYNMLMNANYKFIAISGDRWQKEKENYISNIKNNKPYTYKEEPTSDKQVNEEQSIENENIENIALNIFGKEKIEIE